MKIAYMNLMPYRDLPKDFNQKYESVWVTLPNAMFDPWKGHEMYNEYLDGYEYAIDLGFDAVAVNEHHSNAYGLMPSPNLFAAMVARKVRKSEKTCLLILGDSLALYNPPVRVAEELAALDVVTGGRVIAGFPVGTSMDTNYVYGIPPAELRERYYEAYELVKKAWTTRDVFHFNGNYTQLRYVNVWPRPIQQPHPPIWIPGAAGSIETYDFCANNEYQYCYLSFYGHNFAEAKLSAYWERRQQLGKDMNPYRTAFYQTVCVSETDERAQLDYEEHVNYFFNNSLHVSPRYAEAPGYRSAASIRAGMQSQYSSEAAGAQLRRGLNWKQLVEQGFVVAGSPASVRDQLREAIKRLRIGHLLVGLNFGSMPHYLAMKNIELFAKEVMPYIRDIWDDQWPVVGWPETQKREQSVQTGA
ncbi:MAG: LLM class flavin-dependent oxidoreductase [Alicyclobacillaceae bacterium]|nr:LLM class flavin-dependent oxidoreductase [Alicyclobacillaceae bacterium]